jgi:hypothetical protein
MTSSFRQLLTPEQRRSRFRSHLREASVNPAGRTDLFPQTSRRIIKELYFYITYIKQRQNARRGCLSMGALYQGQDWTLKPRSGLEIDPKTFRIRKKRGA